MRFVVEGANPQTGKELRREVEANDEEGAAKVAASKGMYVASVQIVPIICKNCSRPIGRLEAIGIYNNQSVCQECLRFLSGRESVVELPKTPTRKKASKSTAMAIALIALVSAVAISILWLVENRPILASPSVSESEELTTEKVAAFSRKLISEIQASNQASRDKLNAETPRYDGIIFETKISTDLVSTDIKRSDSMINPVVAEIIFNEITLTMNPKDSFNYSHLSSEQYTADFSFKNGKFSLIGGQQKCTMDSITQMDSSDPEKSHEGLSSILPSDAWSDEISTIQK